MTMAEPQPKEKKPEWQASFHGVPIYTDPRIPKGMVEFYDDEGTLIGTIWTIAKIHIGTDRS